jgi:N utilization substance protein A
VAVTSNDARVEPTGACIGVRGTRIKNIIEQLGGEHIDVVRWHPSPDVFVKEALQPATVKEVLLFQQLGRAAALVTKDQLSKAIGKSGHNVRLASLLTGWDIEVMTHEELNTTLARAEEILQQIPNLTPEQVARVIEDGFWSFSDLSCATPDYLAQLLGISEEQAEEIIAFAEKMAEAEEEQEPKHLGEAVRKSQATAEETVSESVAPAEPEPSAVSEAAGSGEVGLESSDSQTAASGSPAPLGLEESRGDNLLTSESAGDTAGDEAHPAKPSESEPASTPVA